MKTKRIIALLGLVLFSCSGGEKQVVICVSSGAYAYHYDEDCMGLGSCTHERRWVSLKEAKEDYNRDICGLED